MTIEFPKGMPAWPKSNAIDLVLVARATMSRSTAIIKRIDSRGPSVPQIARLGVQIE